MLVRLYTPLICYWGRRVGLQEQDAAELAQEVFILLLRKLPEFNYDHKQSFRGWLRTVTLNKWREQCRRRQLPIELDGDPLANLSVPDPAESFWEEELRQHLATRALRLMQTEFETATWKACWEVTVNGRAPEEVAGELGITLGAVYAAKARVLRRLRQKFAGLLD